VEPPLPEAEAALLKTFKQATKVGEQQVKVRTSPLCSAIPSGGQHS
jgi:hypothetical protein